MSKDIPTFRWGIITTGTICQWFVEDLLLDRPGRKVNHLIQAIGTSSIEKGQAFVAKHVPNHPVQPAIYASYEECYADPEADCVYIGTPHAFHKRDCLAAIAAGKNVLCEKPFTLNAREAREVFYAAAKKGVYVAEAMKLRHRPLCLELKRMLHEEKVIGEVFRMSSDFFLLIDIASLPDNSRYKDVKLGAGTMLDIGIYPLTWAMMVLDPRSPEDSERPQILASQTFQEGIEVSTCAILKYESLGRQGIVTSSTIAHEHSKIVATVDGTDGYVEVEGPYPSNPVAFTVYPKLNEDPSRERAKSEGKKYEFEDSQIGQGFVWEADNIAIDVLNGKTESSLMPWKESIRVMEIMDEIRRQGGTRCPCDDDQRE